MEAIYKDLLEAGKILRETISLRRVSLRAMMENYRFDLILW